MHRRLDQRADDLPQQPGVCDDTLGRALADQKPQRDVLRLGEWEADEVDRLVEERFEAHLVAGQPVFARLQRGELGDGVDRAHHARRALADRREDLMLALVERPQALALQDLEIAGHRRERGRQLVGDGVQEVVAEVFHPIELRLPCLGLAVGFIDLLQEGIDELIARSRGSFSHWRPAFTALITAQDLRERADKRFDAEWMRHKSRDAGGHGQIPIPWMAHRHDRWMRRPLPQAKGKGEPGPPGRGEVEHDQIDRDRAERREGRLLARAHVDSASRLVERRLQRALLAVLLQEQDVSARQGLRRLGCVGHGLLRSFKAPKRASPQT